MGIFSDLKGMKAVQKIAHGGVDKLSLLQIVCLITNMPDAKRNLTEAQFNDVYDLYKNYRKCTTKLPMDADGYVNICINIIEKFNALAPYEKYSGGNELEWKMMLDELRHDSNS